METSKNPLVSLTRVAHTEKASSLSLATQRSLLRTALVAIDVLALTLAFRIAFWIRFELQITLAPEIIPSTELYQSLTSLLIVVWLVIFALYDLYDPRAKLGGVQEYAKTFSACTMAMMAVIVCTFAFPQFVISRMWLVSVWLLSFLAVGAGRFALRRVVYAVRRRGYLVSPAIIVGTNEEAVALGGFLRDQQPSGVRLLGFVTTGFNGRPADLASPILGSVDDLPSLVEARKVEDLIVAITALSREDLLRLSERAEPLPVHLRLSSGLYELLTTHVEVQTLGTVPLMSVHKVRLNRAQAMIKTLLDSSLAGLGLLLFSPVLLAIALWVKLDSHGPVFHRRRVLGVSGRPFDAFKFRTMHVNGAELLDTVPGAIQQLQNDHKLKDDPRITRAGRWLRRFSLDELPQLVNVLLGQMSLVGPRMITLDEVAQYGRDRLNLLTVKPGITGLWQVSGRSDLSYAERVRIDMYYVRNYSVWLDLQILFVQTLPAVVRGRGAY
jgi:exopolysaccharide biosynthesis polyprenyl glycosylphosphotransferase